MAKQKSLISFEGTFMGMTQVRSKTYGPHVRAARGTHKPVEVNDSFRQSASDMAVSILPAKMMNNALAPLRTNFGGGQLWQELVSLFKKQYKSTGEFDFTALHQWEIHKSYPLSRLITFSNVQAEVNLASGKVSLTVAYTGAFQFKRSYINGYRISVQELFPVLSDKMTYSEVQQLPVLALPAKAQEHTFTFDLPAKATVVLFAVKLEGCTSGVEDKSHATKGMRIEGVLKLGAC